MIIWKNTSKSLQIKDEDGNLIWGWIDDGWVKSDKNEDEILTFHNKKRKMFLEILDKNEMIEINTISSGKRLALDWLKEIEEMKLIPDWFI